MEIQSIGKQQVVGTYYPDSYKWKASGKRSAVWESIVGQPHTRCHNVDGDCPSCSGTGRLACLLSLRPVGTNTGRGGIGIGLRVVLISRGTSILVEGEDRRGVYGGAGWKTPRCCSCWSRARLSFPGPATLSAQRRYVISFSSSSRVRKRAVDRRHFETR